MTFDGREGGYIKFFRSVESSEDFIGMRPDQCWIAMRIVQLANFKPGFMPFRGQAIPVGRGELGHTLETIARRTGATIKVVRTTIDRLVRTGFLGTRTGTVAGTAYRILIVRNYERFQGEDEEPGTAAGTAAGSDRARTGHEAGSDRALREEGEEGEEGNLFPASGEAGQGDEGKKAAGKKTTDPRFAPLRAAWEQEFAATHAGAAYRWQGPPDAKGIHRVIAVPVEEFREVARRGLNATGFLRCGTVAKLTSGEVWNQLAGTGPPGPRLVTAGASDRSAFGKGEVAL